MSLNFLFLLLLAYSIKAESGGYPIASDDIEGSPECGPCQQYKKTKFGELKCVAIPYCCPGKASTIRCLLDPCIFFRSACSRARHCVPQNCNGGCSPIYYDSHLDPINASECSKAVLQTSKSSNRQRVEKPRKGFLESKNPEVDVPENFISPSGVKYPKERKIKESGGFKKQILLWPSHIGVNSSG